MTVFINPGSGPVRNASRENAVANMQSFCADLADAGHSVGLAADQEERELDGRWTFDLTVDGAAHEVEIPGAPLDQVRFVDGPEQNIWDFPRLYVDGSSWVWMFALRACERDDEDAS